MDDGQHRLAKALADFDDEQLASLFGVRPDLASPPPTSFADLAQRAGSSASVAACLAQLDEGCTQVLHAMVLVTRPTSVARVAEFLGPGADHDAVAVAIGCLEHLGLAFRDVGGLYLVGGAQNLRHPADLGPGLRPLLTSMTTHALAGIANRAAVDVRRGAPKHEVVGQLATALSATKRIIGLVGGGPDGTAELAMRLAAGFPEARVSPSVWAATPASPVGWLLSRGLVIEIAWDRVVMPAEVSIALRGGSPFPDLALEPPAVRGTPVEAAAVDVNAIDAGLQLVAGLGELLDDWGRTPARLLKEGGIGVRELRRAAKLVGLAEGITARVIELALVAGLVASDYAAGMALPTAAVDDWVALDSADRWVHLARAWLSSPRHLSLAGAVDGKGKPIPAMLPRAPDPHAVACRVDLVEVLASIDPGLAPDEGDVAARARWRAPARWGQGPIRAGRLATWIHEEASLVGLTALGALSTHGRLAADGDMGGAAERLRARAPAIVSEFVLQADLTAMAAGQLDHATRRELELVADLESSGAASVYRFSEASLARAFEAGRTAEEISSFLEGHASRAVPQALTYLISDLGRRFGQLRVGSAGAFIRSDDVALLAEIENSRRTSRLGLRSIAPTVLVASADAATVGSTLKAAGYLPAQEGDDGMLVATRIAPRRAPAPREAGGGWARSLPGRYQPPAPPDVAEVVARLRRGPAPTRAAAATSGGRAARGARPGPVPAEPPMRGQLGPVGGSSAARPGHIVRQADEVAALLRAAVIEEWPLRLAYVTTGGETTHFDVVPVDVDDHTALVGHLPTMGTTELALGRIEWARVMTEAEEEALS